MEFDDVLVNQPVVIDNGSGVIKAGFAGDEQPKCYIPSFVGRPKHARAMAGAVEGDTFIGKKHKNFYVYTEELKTLSEEHPVLLTEAPLNPRQNRETAAQIFFETFNVPALFISIQAVLALYASGRTTGIVLDSGDGFSMPHAIRRVDVAGRDVTEHLQLQLRKAGHHLHTTAEKEVVRVMKEKCCYVALNPSAEEKEAGEVIKLGPERFRAPEILFNPELVGLEDVGIHQVVVDSINKADMDLRKSLFFEYWFGDRLLNEVKRLALKDIKIKIFAPPERKYSTWIGGSILASLSTFKKLWLSSEDYDEDPDLVIRRFT
ncbi:actin-like protein [Chytridium lagenaria]|nr:actin-like protein [Chytridium lagenaria]